MPLKNSSERRSGSCLGMKNPVQAIEPGFLKTMVKS